MWNRLVSVQTISTRAAGCAVLLAFLAGITSLLSAIGTLPQLLSALSVVFAFVSGFAGLLALVAEKRKHELEDTQKRTPPKLDVAIKTDESGGQFYVVIEPKNNVAFEEQFLIVTRNDEIISGVPLDWAKIFPNSASPNLLALANMDLSKVKDNYVELRFQFRSIYSAELPDLNLSGKLIKRYSLSPDRKYCIPIEQ
jgi:hypothetical protein